MSKLSARSVSKEKSESYGGPSFSIRIYSIDDRDDTYSVEETGRDICAAVEKILMADSIIDADISIPWADRYFGFKHCAVEIKIEEIDEYKS
jgi:hypothetical protein